MILRPLLNRMLFRLVICAVLTVQAISSATSQSATPQSPGSRAEQAGLSQTIIYAFGASLFYQDVVAAPANSSIENLPREEKLALPAGAQIEFLSGSRDGKTLAFAANKSVYFYETDSKTLTLVTPQDGGKYIYPSISPDGKSVSCRPYRANATLCILSRDGAVRDMGPSTKGATKSRFTPDAKAIYFANGPDLLRIPTGNGEAGKGEAERVVRGHYIENFSVNTQGFIVAPVPFGSAEVKPALIDHAGDVTKLAFDSNDFNNPIWSPDGTSVAFSLRPREGGEANAQGIYIWKNIAAAKEIRKISDAQSNAGSGFVWR